MDTEDDARYEEWLDRLRDEFRNDPDFIDEIRSDPNFIDDLEMNLLSNFRIERLQSYFLQHAANLLDPPCRALQRAKTLQSIDVTAAFIFGIASIELAIRSALLRPMIYGVLDEQVAPMLLDLIFRQIRGMKDTLSVLNSMLSAFAGFVLDDYIPPHASKPLHEILPALANKRNAVVHQGQEANRDDVQNVISIATDIMSFVVPKVLNNLSLEICPSGVIAQIRSIS